MQVNARYPRFRRIALSFRANANHPGLHIQTRPERTSRLTLGLGFRGDGGGGHGGGCERGRLRRAMVARGERSSKKYLNVDGWVIAVFWLASWLSNDHSPEASSELARYTRRPLSSSQSISDRIRHKSNRRGDRMQMTIECFRRERDDNGCGAG